MMECTIKLTAKKASHIMLQVAAIERGLEILIENTADNEELRCSRLALDAVQNGKFKISERSLRYVKRN